MSAETYALLKCWTVGDYRCTLTAPKVKAGELASFSIEWSPTQPKRLSTSDIHEYRRGRDAALRALARELGVRVAVLEA